MSESSSSVAEQVAKQSYARIWRALKADWWVVVISALLGGVAAVGLCALQTPIYESTATLYVSSATDDNTQSVYQGSLASQQRAESYAKLVSSDTILDEAVRESGLGISASDANQMLSASAEPNTVLLTVSARNASAVDAAALANATAVAMSSYVSSLERPINGGAASAKLTVVSRGDVAGDPVAPNVKRMVGLFVSLAVLVGVLLILLRIRLDNRVRDQHDVESVLDAPVLTSVPFERSLSEDRKVFDFASGAGPLEESYRRLRTNVGYINVDGSAKVLVVSSCLAGEGKTTTAINLSAAMAEGGNRVLLVDADLRRPVVADSLGLSSGAGLSDVLRGAASVGDVLQRSGDGSFEVLAAGALPPNPAELLDSDKAKSMFRDLRDIYDTIIMDSPPILPVTDSAVLAGNADGLLLVVGAGSPRVPELKRAREELAMSGSRIVGVVMNRSSELGSYGSGQYYQSAYRAN